MNVYKVPERLFDRYHGAGYAFAGVSPGGDLLDFVYLRDIDENFDDEQTAEVVALRAAADPAMQARGSFFEVPGKSTMAFGMISCYEFCEL